MAEDKIIKKLVERGEKIDKLVTNEFNDFRVKILQNQEEIMNILKRLDERRIFTII